MVVEDNVHNKGFKCCFQDSDYLSVKYMSMHICDAYLFKLYACDYTFSFRSLSKQVIYFLPGLVGDSDGGIHN